MLEVRDNTNVNLTFVLGGSYTKQSQHDKAAGISEIPISPTGFDGFGILEV